MAFNCVSKRQKQQKILLTAGLLSCTLIVASCSNSNNPQVQASDNNLASVQLDGLSNGLPLSAIPTQKPRLSLLNEPAAQTPATSGQNFASLPRDVPGGKMISNKTKFSSKTFGVAGSPRVTTSKNVRKGGGRYQVGKPYTIRGIRYVPKEDPDYKAVGLASWYGPNFHGRLTANGEVYDQFALSAAHPTMPLPSYAKVTNLENGASVMVRVNDRGPFSKKRIIDLSTRAAQLLGYTKQGVAKVKVEYAGKARMDGLDEEFLVASYRPGGLAPSGNTIVAANAAPEQKAPATPTVAASQNPTPSSFDNSRFGATNNSVDVSLVSQPRPSVGVNGYQAQAEVSESQKAIQGLIASPMVAPENGMGDLASIKIAPISSKVALKNISDFVSDYGPVSVFEEDGGYAVQATVDPTDLETIQSFLDQ